MDSLSRLVALVLLAVGLTATDASSHARPPAAHGTAFALLADNRLVAVRIADVAVVAERRLAPAPPVEAVPRRFPGHQLALSPDGRTLFVLAPGWSSTPGTAGEPDRVAALDVATAWVTGTFVLPDVGGGYRSLAVGPKSGRLYLFGNRVAPGARPAPRTPPATAGQGAIITRIDPATGAVEATWPARSGDGRDWLVYQGAVSPDERTLYVSYHGTDTTGIDRFDLGPDGLRRCPSGRRPGTGCIGGHGGFAFSGEGLLVATGDSVILATDHTGAVRGAVDTELSNNHLMEFAIDPTANRLNAVGSCGYAGGFSAVDLRHPGALAPQTTPGAWAWQTPPSAPVTLLTPMPDPLGRGVPCGERLALGPGPVLVVTQAPAGNVRVDFPGRVVVLDPTTGAERGRVTTSSWPLDILVAPPHGV